MIDRLQFLTEFNTLTSGTGFNVIIFIIGLVIFIGLKTNDVGTNLVISGFLMTLLAFLLSFIGLINNVMVIVYFGIFILGVIMKIIMR